jgi:2-furoyl-CoA dehydrogenase FAD binding subunit
MVAAAFEHVTASSYDEAAAQLAAYGDEARILAGGQSLLPMLNLRLTKPAVLISVCRRRRTAPSGCPP